MRQRIDNQPIYAQAYDHVCEQIMRGELREGERAPSVRELAMSWGINPNTVMRAYFLLANDGIVINRRGVGFFVAAGAAAKVLSARRQRFITLELPGFAERMRALGFSYADLEALERRRDGKT